MNDELNRLKQECEEELRNILSYWMHHAIDPNGGFYGKIDNDNIVHPLAPKGAVLNARILWTFSSAYSYSKNKEYLQTANRAYEYINAHFIDNEFGGIYWTVTRNGAPEETKKQVYAAAFVLYGLSEYYRACEEEKVKQQAVDLYNTLVRHGYDKTHGGFYEAFTREWKPIYDQRLSGKDAK